MSFNPYAPPQASEVSPQAVVPIEETRLPNSWTVLDVLGPAVRALSSRAVPLTLGFVGVSLFETGLGLALREGARFRPRSLRCVGSR